MLIVPQPEQTEHTRTYIPTLEKCQAYLENENFYMHKNPCYLFNLFSIDFLFFIVITQNTNQ